MKRPAIVTGFAYLNLMSILSAFWLFDARAHIGTDVIFTGSLLPPRMQWNLVNVGIVVTTLTTIGFFRGWNWARWLALALSTGGYVALFPLGNLHALPGFVFQIAGSVVAFGLLFFSPAVQAYFTTPSAHKGAFSVRATISTGLLLLSAFTAHSIVMGAFRRTIPTEVTWIGLGVFLLPTLVLSMFARWQLAASIREISAVLLGVTVFFAYMLLGSFLNLRFTYPAVTPYLGWANSALLTLTLGASGIVLAACAARWLRVATD